MAKTCPKCSFKNNPDDANYCGNCGANIASQGHSWKLYNSTKHNLYEKDDEVAIPRWRYNYFLGIDSKQKQKADHWQNFWRWWEEHEITDWLKLFFWGSICLFFFYIAYRGCTKEETESKLVENRTIENKIVDTNGNYELVKEDGKYNFKNANGKYLSDKWFSYADNFSDGCAPIKLNEKWNYINKNGDYISKEWFSNEYPFSEGWGAVESKDKWNYISTEGKYLSNNWYDQCFSFNDGWGRVKYDGKWNYVNSKGRFISNQWFENAGNFNNGKALVKLNGKSFYIDTKGNKVK